MTMVPHLPLFLLAGSVALNPNPIHGPRDLGIGVSERKAGACESKSLDAHDVQIRESKSIRRFVKLRNEVNDEYRNLRLGHPSPS